MRFAISSLVSLPLEIVGSLIELTVLKIAFTFSGEIFECQNDDLQFQQCNQSILCSNIFRMVHNL
jgi:hypothetical protein